MCCETAEDEEEHIGTRANYHSCLLSYRIIL